LIDKKRSFIGVIKMRNYCLPFMLLIAAGLLYSGCLKIYITAKDEYPDDFIVYKINPQGALGGEDNKLKLYLYPQVVTQPGKDPIYSLIVMQRTRYENLILKTKKGNSLSLMIDGKKYEFTTTDRLYGDSGIDSSEFPLWRHRRFDRSCITIEKVSYEATFDIMKKIANAAKVEVTLKGEGEKSAQKHFIEQHFEIFQHFVKFVDRKILT
jgi:hypothetical protein